MRLLFEIDLKDYKKDGTVGIRPSVRGIFIKDGRIAMIYSHKYETKVSYTDLRSIAGKPAICMSR